MGLHASDSGGGTSFDPVDAGIHQGVCYGVLDLGTQYNTHFGNSSHKCVIIWEMPDERIEIDGEDLPRVISRIFTLSLHEKAHLRRILKSWRGRDFTDAELAKFDISKLLTVNCSLQVIHNKKGDKTYANIENVLPLMPHMTAREPENEVLYFSFEEHTNIPENTPGWIVDMIKGAEEWGQSKPEQAEEYDEMNPPPDDSSEIPF